MALQVLGLLLVAAGIVLVLADSDGLAARMPTQVPPRRFAQIAIVMGAISIALGITSWFVS